MYSTRNFPETCVASIKKIQRLHVGLHGHYKKKGLAQTTVARVKKIQKCLSKQGMQKMKAALNTKKKAK